MLNRITGWLLFTQVSYLALVVFLAVIDAISRHAIFALFSRVRHWLHFENTYVRLSDYIYYPMTFTAVFNLAFMVAFLWMILRRRYAPSLLSDFFSILNVVYIAGSGWVLLMMFTNSIREF